MNLKRLYFLLILLCVNPNSLFAQLDFDQPNYDKGLRRMQANDFVEAARFFNGVSNEYLDVNARFNMAVCNLKIGDTINFCKHLEFAVYQNDKEAIVLFNKYCLKIDTVYKNEYGTAVTYIDSAVAIQQSITRRHDSLHYIESTKLIDTYKSFSYTRYGTMKVYSKKGGTILHPNGESVIYNKLFNRLYDRKQFSTGLFDNVNLYITFTINDLGKIQNINVSNGPIVLRGRAIKILKETTNFTIKNPDIYYVEMNFLFEPWREKGVSYQGLLQFRREMEAQMNRER